MSDFSFSFKNDNNDQITVNVIDNNDLEILKNNIKVFNFNEYLNSTPAEEVFDDFDYIDTDYGSGGGDTTVLGFLNKFLIGSFAANNQIFNFDYANSKNVFTGAELKSLLKNNLIKIASNLNSNSTQEKKLFSEIADNELLTREENKQLSNNNIIVLDTETTGLNENAQVLQLSIIDGSGKTLFNEYVKPEGVQGWEQAQKVNHISPEMVANKKSLKAYEKEITAILNKVDYIVGYNVAYDLRLLQQSGIKLPDNTISKSVDVMKAFSLLKPVYVPFGNYDNYFTSLAKCSEYFKYKPDDNANFHNSLEDCKATLACFNGIMYNSTDSSTLKPNISENDLEYSKNNYFSSNEYIEKLNNRNHELLVDADLRLCFYNKGQDFSLFQNNQMKFNLHSYLKHTPLDQIAFVFDNFAWGTKYSEEFVTHYSHENNLVTLDDTFFNVVENTTAHPRITEDDFKEIVKATLLSMAENLDVYTLEDAFTDSPYFDCTKILQDKFDKVHDHFPDLTKLPEQDFNKISLAYTLFTNNQYGDLHSCKNHEDLLSFVAKFNKDDYSQLCHFISDHNYDDKLEEILKNEPKLDVVKTKNLHEKKSPSVSTPEKTKSGGMKI